MLSARVLLSVLISLLLAGTAWAQPPMASTPDLILIDEDGNEVLRLAPGELSTGLQSLPAGQYVLTVSTPGKYGIAIEEDTGIDVNRPGAARPPSGRPGGPAGPPENDQPAVLDFDRAPGDQGMRMVHGAGAGEQFEVQLTATDLPEFYGWSAVLEFDPDQLALVDNSFRPSDFISRLMPMVDSKEGRVEVGGANFTRATSKGDGELGVVAFETLAEYSGRAEIRLTALNLRSRRGTTPMEVACRAVISRDPQGPGGPRQDPGPGPGPEPEPDRTRPALTGQAAMDALLNDNACPGCDLSKANLMQQDLRDADLSGADLTEANLFRAKLAGANLHGANLHKANALQTDFRDADLTEADLSDARLTGAKMMNADLNGAIVEGARLTGANFTGSTWIDGGECGRGSIGRCRQ